MTHHPANPSHNRLGEKALKPLEAMKTELEFYNEHPDQAIENLKLPERIEALREVFRKYMAARRSGPKETAAEMLKRPERWARNEYKKAVSKTFNEGNLRDFLGKRSSLRMESRLLVHVFMWTSLKSYRNDWGPFREHDPHKDS